MADRLSGTLFQPFLLRYLQLMGHENLDLSILQDARLQFFQTRKLPFLVPPGMLDNFCEVLEPFGVVLGEAVRPSDAEQMDVVTRCLTVEENRIKSGILLASAEFKDRKEQVDLEAMCMSFQSFINHGTDIHFLVCDNMPMQNTYPAFKAADNVAVLQLLFDQGNNKHRLEYLCSPPPTPTKLFILLPLWGHDDDEVKFYLINQNRLKPEDRLVKKHLVTFIEEHLDSINVSWKGRNLFSKKSHYSNLRFDELKEIVQLHIRTTSDPPRSASAP